MKFKTIFNLDKEIGLFLKYSLFAFLSRILGALAVFIVQIFLARKLGASGFGLFSLSITMISVLAVFGRFGMDTLILRLLSSKKNAQYSGFARFSTLSISKFLFVSTVLLTVMLVIFSGEISEKVFGKDNLESVLISISPLLFFMVIGYVLGDAYKAIGYSSFGVLLQNTFLPLLFLVSFLFLPDSWYVNPSRSALVYSVISCLILIGGFYYWFKVTEIGSDFQIENIWSQLRHGFPLLLASSGGLLVAWTDVMVLGIYESDYTIGLYTAASKIALLTSLILVSINAVVAPKFSSFIVSGDMDKLSLYVKRVSFLSLIIALIPTAIIIIYPDYLLSVFGENFITAKNILIVLAIGQFINVACGSVGYLLVMAEYEKVVRNIIWFVAVLNVILSVFFVNYFGAIGVAYATAFSMSLWNVLLVYAVKSKLGFYMLGKLA